MADDKSTPRHIATDAGSTDLNLEEWAYEPRPGFKRTHVVIGKEGDPAAPQFFWAQDPPGITWDAQSSRCDFVLVYLQGSQKVGDKWHHAGEARLVKAGEVYGPIEAGPEGSTIVMVFANADYVPVFTDKPVTTE